MSCNRVKDERVPLADRNNTPADRRQDWGGSMVGQESSVPMVIGLVGPDVEHLDTGGGTAAMSLRIVDGFASSTTVRIVPIRNYYDFALCRRISAAVDAMWQVWRRRHELTTVHIQVTGGLSIERDLPLAMVAKLVSLPVVVQFHGAGQAEDYDGGTSLHRWCYRKLLATSSAVAVLGKHAEEWVRRVSPSAAVRVVGNSVVALPSAPPLGDTPNVLFAGRLGKRKGIYDLVAALEELAEQGLEFHADVAGDGETEEVAKLVQASDRLRHRVRVLGWQPASALQELMIRSWLFVLPSYAEGMPLAVMEAMGCGRAVVATRVNEMDQLVTDNESGILVSPGDVSELAKSIDRILSDRELATNYGRRAWEIAHTSFSEERLFGELLELWRCGANI
jgi:glycosyltransferase involved in cell wall biosynthesis